MNNKKPRLKDFETQVAAVDDYLFSDRTTREVGSEYGVGKSTIIRWYNNDEVLMKVARRRGLAYEDVIRLIPKKEVVELMPKKGNPIEFEKKVEIVDNYLFSDQNVAEVGNKYGVVGSSVLRWYNDDRILEEVAGKRGITYEDIIRLRDEKIESRNKRKLIPFEIKVNAVSDYLLSWEGERVVGGDNEIHKTSVGRWCYNELVLQEVAKRNGMAYEDVIRLRNIKKQIESTKRFDFETQVAAVDDYLFSDRTTREVGDTYDTVSIDRWYRDVEVLKGIARKRGMSYEDIVGIRDGKVGKYSITIKNAPTFQEFVKTHEDVQQVVRLFTYNKNMVDPLVARILVLWYPGIISEEDAIEYLPSLGPYLGKFRKPIPTDILGDVLSRVPKPVIDRDQMLREGFLKLGRDYYTSLMMEKEQVTSEDKKAIVELIRDAAEHEENESLKWLYQELYDEFNRFASLSERLNELRRRVRT